MLNRFDSHGNMLRLHVPNTPTHNGGLPGNVNAGIAAEKPVTWGSRMLTRALVVQIEPATQTKPTGLGDIDGELYTADCRQGNLQATVKANGRRDKPVGYRYLLHPFAGGTVGNYYAQRMHESRKAIGQATEPNTEVRGHTEAVAS